MAPSSLPAVGLRPELGPGEEYGRMSPALLALSLSFIESLLT